MGFKAIKPFKKILNHWNYLNELNSAQVQAHWPPFDLTLGGEQVEPRPERLGPRT
jgi:hypothetical protein